MRKESFKSIHLPQTNIRKSANFKLFSFIFSFAWLMLILITTSTVYSQIKLQKGTVGKKYEVSLTAEGTSSKVTWMLSAGRLPDGISLDPNTGQISGIPTKAGTFGFKLTATDSGVSKMSGEQIFTVDIAEEVVPKLTIKVSSPDSPNPGDNEKKDQPTISQKSNSDAVTINVSNEFKMRDDIDLKQLKIKPEKVDKVITELIKSSDSDEKLKLDDYCVIHLVRWKPAAGENKAGKFEADDHWYLYQKAKDPKDNTKEIWVEQEKYEGARIYGSRRIAALLIHLDARESWDIKYGVKVNMRIPAPLQNALDLAGIALSKGPGAEQSPVNLWGGGFIRNIRYVPSDVVFSANILFADDTGTSSQQAKEFGKKYVNEGRYHWDVSVGIPIKSVSEIKYDTTNNVVTARKVEKQNAYGFLNIFLNPKGVDLESDSFLSTPHLVFGVPITGKPLDNPVAGLGFGVYKTPIKFNFFVGAVFSKVRDPKTLNVGDPADAAKLETDFRTHRVTKLTFGVNFSIRQIKEAFNKK
jgi:hypothetical protein